MVETILKLKYNLEVLWNLSNAMSNVIDFIFEKF